MPVHRETIAYHLITTDAWDAADIDTPLRVASLEAEGFVHLTHRMPDLVDVANELYRDDPRSHVVLAIALDRLTASWRYDGDDRFPHVYGPLDREAIIDVRPMRRDRDGAFSG